MTNFFFLPVKNENYFAFAATTLEASSSTLEKGGGQPNNLKLISKQKKGKY